MTAALRCWSVSFSGHWLGGCGFVFAETVEDATAQAREALQAIGLGDRGVDLREVPIARGCTLLFDGDY